MSDLFLDTETRWFIPAVAKALLDSGYCEQTLNAIWRHEALPEFGSNLLCVAGEWAALPVNERRLARRARRPFWRRLRLGVHLAERANQPTWMSVLQLRNHLATYPTGMQVKMASVFGAFACAWTEASLDDLLFVDEKVRRLSESALSRAICLEAFEQAFLPAYKSLLYEGEEKAQRVANVRALIERAF